MKPLLLMDVNGPMNPFRARWYAQRTPADGYQFHELTPEGDQTYWGADANRLIAPILGLPSDLPVISLPEPSVLMSRRSWKAERIVDWVGRRSFAWFDDEINRPTRLWLASQDAVGRHLAHRVPAEVGLTNPTSTCSGISRRTFNRADLPRRVKARLRDIR